MTKDQIKQKINTKRGLQERKRRKRWLYFKNTGRKDLYYSRKKEIQRSFESPKMESWWKRMINLIRGLFIKRQMEN